MIKNITNTFKNGCNSPQLTYSEYVKLNGTIIPVKAELSDDCYDNGNFIGTFIFKQITFEVSNEYDFKEKEFKYYKKVNNEDICFGTYITTEIKNNDTTNVLKVIGVDYGLKTQVEYKSSLDYDTQNITLLDVWNECCSLSGIVSGISTFTNDTFIVEDDQFTGTGATIRNVMEAIAQVSCNFVKVNNDDKVYLQLTEETNEIINEYVELEDKRDTQPINAVLIGNKNIEGSEVTKTQSGVLTYHWLKIYDNPFLYTREKREAVINNIYNKIYGFAYSSFKSKTTFKPYLTCGDKIRFRNREGQLVDSIILRYNHKYEDITLEAPSITNASLDYKRPESEIEIIHEAKIEIDNNKTTITSLAQMNEENRSSITQIQQTAVDLTIEVNNKANKGELDTEIEELKTTIQQNSNSISGIVEGTTSVGSVETTIGTLNNEGLRINQSTSDTSTLINAKGLEVEDKTGNKLLTAVVENGEGIVSSANINVNTYLTIGNVIRAERCITKERISEIDIEALGFFWTGE